MSATCPACGVAVLPGYARCPKCRKPLPSGRRGTVVGAGGTAMEDRRFPIVAVGGAVGVALVIILLFALRGGSDTKAAPGTATGDETGEPIERPAIPTQTTTQTTFAETPPTGPDPTVAAADLDRQLKKQRLWGTVQVIGERADVRSGACEDPGMRPVLDGAAASLKSAGLTKLRCLAQSGAVVFERDL